MERKYWLAMGKATFAVMSWGASFIATKVALRDVAPATVVWLRFAMGVAILAAAVLLWREFSWPTRRDLGYFALLGFLGITFHQWLQSTGLVTAQASTTAWIITTTPVYMAILGWLFLREKLGWWRVLGIALASLGVLAILSKGNFPTLLTGRSITTGDVLILISAPNWAVFSVLSRYGLRKNAAAHMMLFVMGLGWLFSSALFFAGPGLGDISHLKMDGWLGIGFLGIFCSGLAYIFWYDALEAMPASQLGVFLYIEPLVTVVVAFLILDEAILAASLAGGALIFAGIWMVNRRQGQK